MAGAAAQLMPLSAIAASPICAKTPKSFPPINFIYGHFHNSIRAELSLLADRVRSLEVPGEGVELLLADLRQRYKFLEQVYKYHSTVEDEVLYPALDSKVRNVTLAYSIEHQDEEILFEQLSQLLSTALEEPEMKRKGTVRTLICKVEEIHTTLRKHLAKEEEQLLPLLLHHFTYAEQAELVAQFLYSIPLETVERVLSQLKPRIPRDEQEQLLIEIRNVIPDNLLSQLLVTWLQLEVDMPSADVTCASAERSVMFTCCGNPAACIHGPPSTAAPLIDLAPRGIGGSTGTLPCSSNGEYASMGASPGHSSEATGPDLGRDTAGTGAQGAVALAGPACGLSVGGAGAASTGPAVGVAAASNRKGRAPLQDIIHFHRSICSSLADFAREARALQLGRDIASAHLSALLDRHRFLRSVYVFHSISEEEVLFPEVQRLAAHVGGVAARQCEKDHQAELSSFEDLGRLLADVRAFARRGRKEVASMLEKLCCSAEAVHASIEHHMQREEADVFPLLEGHLCEAQQRTLVYRTIRAMPLRLLERVMPWVVSRLDNTAATALLSNIQLGAPSSDQALVELLSRWARRGWRGSSPVGTLDPSVSSAEASGPRRASLGTATDAAGAAGDGGDPEVEAHGVNQPGLRTSTCGPRFLREALPAAITLGFVVTAADEDGADSKRRRISEDLQRQHRAHSRAGTQGCGDAGTAGAAATPFGLGRDGGDDWEHEMSTAPRALLRSQASGSPDDRAYCGGSPGSLLDHSVGQGAAGPGGAHCGGSGGGYNPIDHIFQFHKALRQELKQLEADAMRLEYAVLSRVRQHQQVSQPLSVRSTPPPMAAAAAASPMAAAAASSPMAAAAAGLGDGSPLVGGRGQQLLEAPAQQQQQPVGGTPPCRVATPALMEQGLAGMADGAGAANSRGGLLPFLQVFHGRFQFLQGIYRAHSKAEDEIVFPALEAKQALRNVSHAYTLDHRQEEQLFADLETAIDNLRAVDLLSTAPEAELSRQVMGVRRMCAAIRASLETHIRSEESELWPLFTEHFSREEQQYLVGVIIGRTGAQVLQALLPWVSETVSAEERDAMMDSLRQATRNTMFDQWLEAVQAGGVGLAGPGGADGGAPSRAGSMGLGEQAHANQPLQQVAEYLAGGIDADGAVAGASNAPLAGPGGSSQGTLADSTSFRPGWEDIFRMNQQQLEAAIHRVSNDSSLEPERKAYLMQNIMVSKYIVAQQRRMVQSEADQQQLHAAAAAAAACGPAAALPAVALLVADAGGGIPVSEPASAGSGSCGAIHQTFHNAPAAVLGCPHYQRKCQLVAPCCGNIHTCRLCHDESCDHRLDRYAVSEMRCMLCGTRQPVAGTCRCCCSAMARYVCNICHLFDDEPGKDIYHCPFCNVCRRGRGLGVDFFHCMNCNACMSLTLFSSHKCREKCIEGNCPVCHEALFDSSQPIKELPCGHFMHSTCFLTYTRYNYTCPLCCKSVGDMSVYFQMLDSLLASERLPPEYAGRMQQVLCNDCGKMGFTPFHFVYHSCPHCRSYNTRVM